MKLKNLWNKNIVYTQLLNDFRTEQKKELSIKIKGLQGSALPFFFASLTREVKFDSVLFFLTNNTEDALHFYQDLFSFTGGQEKKHIFLFPPYEILPYEDLQLDSQIVRERIKVLSHLINIKQSIEQNSTKQNQTEENFPIIIVSSYRAILTKMVSPDNFGSQFWSLQREGELKLEPFLNYLIKQGYQHSVMIESPGQFSQRGGIIDLFPITEENPVRIELNSDKIESLRFFNLESQRSIKKIEEILLLPQREVYSPLDKNEREGNSFFDYLPAETDIFIQNFGDLEKSVQDFEKECQQCFREKQKSIDKTLLPPEYYYLSWDQLKELLYQKKRLVTIEQWITDHKQQDRPREGEIAGYSEYQIATEPAQNYFGNLDLFFEDIRRWQQEKKNILVLTGNQGRALRLAEILEDRGFTGYQLTALPEVDLYPGTICLSYGPVNYGFSIPSLNLSVITEQEIFGKERDKGYKPPRFQGKPFYQIDELKIGDYVVHINHGIGCYAGIKSRLTEGIRKDYILIKYASSDELYVPVEQLSLIHKYIGVDGAPPKLNRLGDGSWGITKRRVKESIQKVAWELFELYRKRKSMQGFSFSSDTAWQQELEMAFPFEETPDQEKAFQEVKKDMESAQPMERLICGDVGYGKTEIAIRAAFKAVMDSKQVAVLAPTTILAQQHWENFRERMKAFPVKIEMLSRFRSKKEQQEIIANLKKGNIDIIIGTHRLIQSDVIFKDLGLLVVDEEQRFGVSHKERIKKLKEQIDSLTLTATPIPRTLYLSLTGVREMSIINTPPELRLPIVTFFREKTDQIIHQAIRRELERGGQVYYVHNRVQDIDFVSEKLKNLLPEARIVIAHGQMPEEQLENIMIDFLNRKYDVLVCTTIIEIGLDIPNVNTIIIDDAHQFGLAQLYQLRGRVGRSDRRAYAYLLYPSQAMLTDNAKKRLEAIQEFSDLGSGFRLAMRDLEIRGAGNLLGNEQHGFVSEVGFNYYCQLLQDSIDQLLQTDSAVSSYQEKEPEIEVKLASYIPEYYISNPELRISYYQRLSHIKTETELRDIRKELEDIYGPYPEEVENLLLVIGLKLKLKNQDVTKVRITPLYFSIKYQANSSIEHKVKNFIKLHPSKYINQYQKGIHYELKLTAENADHAVNSNYILQQSITFLEQLISESG
jgi:transcription-repair coupling factor (superfamily II helicase)